MKRFASLLLSAVFVMSMAACGGQNAADTPAATTAAPAADAPAATKNNDAPAAAENNDVTAEAGQLALTEPGALPVVKEPVTITVLERHNVATAPFTENRFTAWYEEQTGVKLDVKYSLSSEFADKFNAILASGDYPEMFVVTSVDKNLVNSLGHQGIAQPMEEYIDQYSIHLKALLAEKPWLKKGVTDPDTGHMYGLPGSEESYEHQVWSKLFIYTPFMEKLGFAMPKTTDEFEQFLLAVKEKDPNGNGQADEVPMSFDTTNWDGTYWQSLLDPFVYWDPETYLENKNGKLSFNANAEGYRNGIRWLNKMYNEKLFADDVFTGVDMTALGENPDPILAVSAGHYMGMFTLAGDLNSNRFREYTVIPPLTGPDGTRQATYAGYTPNIQVIVSDKMKNPELAVRWADWFYTTEGTLTGFYGLKGEGWIDPPEKGTAFTGFPILYQRPTMSTENEIVDFAWQWSTPQFRSREIREGMYLSDEDKLTNYDAMMIQMMDEAYGKQGMYTPEKAMPKALMSEPDAARISQIFTPMKSFIDNNFADMVLGRKNIDSDWDAYVSELNSLGWEEYLSIYQKVLDTYNNF